MGFARLCGGKGMSWCAFFGFVGLGYAGTDDFEGRCDTHIMH
jgi:hypothetical protein